MNGIFSDKQMFGVTLHFKGVKSYLKVKTWELFGVKMENGFSVKFKSRIVYRHHVKWGAAEALKEVLSSLFSTPFFSVSNLHFNLFKQTWHFVYYQSKFQDNKIRLIFEILLEAGMFPEPERSRSVLCSAFGRGGEVAHLRQGFPRKI